MRCWTNWECAKLLPKLYATLASLKPQIIGSKRRFGFKMCSRCDLGIPESAYHCIMQCPFYITERTQMFRKQENLGDLCQEKIMGSQPEILYILLGKHPENVTFDKLVKILFISGKHISNIYKSVVAGRT